MKSVNTFNGGMKKDLAKNIFKPDTYFHAENFSLITEHGLSTGNLRNIKGNKQLISLPNCSNVVSIIKNQSGTSQVTILGEVFTIDFSSTSWQSTLSTLVNSNVNLQAAGVTSAYNSDRVVLWGLLDNLFNLITPSITASINNTNGTVNTSYMNPVSTPKMLGWCTIRDDIYIFSSTEVSTTPANAQSQIWKLTYDKFTNNPNISLVYHGLLNLSLGNPIPNPGGVIGNYETETIQNIYFTDNYNRPKKINVLDTNLMAKIPSQLEEVSDIISGVNTIQQLMAGGSLPIGNYAISYRLLQNAGNTSAFSVPSNFIPVITARENGPIIDYQTDLQVLDSSGARKIAQKTLRCKIFNIDTTYDRIEVAIIFKESPGAIPTVKLLPTQPIPANGIYEFLYSGSENTTTLDIEQFLKQTLIFDTVKTIAVKNNVKFNGNVKYGDFDVDFDARAYRFNHSQIAELTNQSGVLEYTINGTSPNYTQVPETADAIQDPETKQAPYSYNNFLYQSDGVTIGGEGLNVKYEFTQIDTDQVNNPDPFRTIIDVYANTPRAPLANVPHNSNTIDVDQDSNTFYDQLNNHGAIGNSTSPYYIYGLKGYQRDEVYRFGIVFFSKKGEASYTHWIGDIRMPNIWMPDTTNATPANRSLFAYPTATSAPSNYYVHNLGIKFTVDISSIKDKIDGYRIVRVKRSDADKTILGQGTLLPTVFNHDTGDPNFGFKSLQNNNRLYDASDLPANHDFDSDVASFVSPEFTFKSYPAFSSQDQIDIIGRAHSQSGFTVQDSAGAPVSNAFCVKNYSIDPNGLAKNGLPVTLSETMVIPNAYTTGGPQSYTFNLHPTIPYVNKSNHDTFAGSLDPQSYGNQRLAMVAPFNTNYGTALGSTWPNTLSTDGITNGAYAIYLANYRRPNNTQYGGNSYSERAYSEYISTGHYRKVDTSSPNTISDYVFGGDTQVSLFDYVNSFKNYFVGDTLTPLSPGDSAYVTEVMSGMLFPVECSFPIQLEDNSLTFSKSQLFGDFPWNGGLTGPRIEISQDFNINFDFFVENDVVTFFPKPFPYIPKEKYDVRVHRSAVKTNGELTDSWGIFQEDDYLDLDTIQGPLNQLITHQDKLISFQDKGVALLSVNERSVTQDTSGSLQLASGGILTRYDYISKVIGSKHQFGFTQSHDGVFFFDINTKNIYKLAQNAPEAITVSKNVAGYFNDNINGLLQISDNPYLNKGLTCTYDYHYNEAILTFRDTVFADSQKATIYSISSEVNNITTVVFDFGRTQVPSCLTQGGLIFVLGYINNQEHTELGAVTSISGSLVTATFLNTQLSNVSGAISVSCATYKSFTIAYNDFASAFTSFYSFIPPVYINDQKNIISPDSSINTLWMHDKGDYCKFYDTVYPSKITLLLNEDPTQTKVFDNYELLTEVTDEANNANIIDQTFNTIRVYNDYQNSDFQTLPTDNGKPIAKRKERTWNIANLRNRVLYTSPSTNIFTDLNTQDILFGERFRDKYLFVDLTYNNLNNYRLIFNSCTYEFRTSAR